MAKEFIPKKLIVDLDESGQVVRSVLQYKIREDGQLEKDLRSISVKAAVDIEDLEPILKTSVDSAGKAEGMGEKVSDDVFLDPVKKAARNVLSVVACLLLLGSGVAQAAWDPNAPQDNDAIEDWPQQARDNWAALETGTDSALLITNAKVSPTAGIVDTKLAQIATASKVHGSAITALASIPSAATDLQMNNGGTNASLTASNGAIPYSTSSAIALLAPTGTAGRMLRSGASAAPTWSTATYPATAGASGNQLISDGTNWISSVPSTGGTLKSVQTFTTSGTWTKPAGVSKVLVEVIGPGGNGGPGFSGGFGGGGGGGGYAKEFITSALGSTETVVVGGPGSGISSSFGSFCSATTGAHGAASPGTPGIAGVGVGGDVNLTGQPGDPGGLYSAGQTQAGSGGMSAGGFGGGGAANISLGSTGNAGSNYGGGGSAGNGSPSNSGGSGATGCVIIWEYA